MEKYTIKELEEVFQGLKEIKDNKRLSAKISYAVGKNLKDIKEIIDMANNTKKKMWEDTVTPTISMKANGKEEPKKEAVDQWKVDVEELIQEEEELSLKMIDVSGVTDEMEIPAIFYTLCDKIITGEPK